MAFLKRESGYIIFTSLLYRIYVYLRGTYNLYYISMDYKKKLIRSNYLGPRKSHLVDNTPHDQLPALYFFAPNQTKASC
jgi:hypothetical protein